MNNKYNDVTLTIDDLEDDERLSVFENCTFEDSPKRVNIQGINFSFAKFSKCVWNTVCTNCNFKGAEGKSVPVKTKLSFNEPIPVMTKVAFGKGSIISGNGKDTEFFIACSDMLVIEERLKLLDTKFKYSVELGNIGAGCGLGKSAMTKRDFIAKPELLVTTDAKDTYSPIEGIPDIVADGESYCNINIIKRDLSGKFKTDVADNDEVTIECTRGRLSDLSINLEKGKGSVTLTSVQETCVSTIRITAEGMSPVEMQIQFAPK